MKKKSKGPAVAYPAGGISFRRPCLACAIFCILLYVLRRMFAGESPVGSAVYGCMLDAGSSGSRIHVYRFGRMADGSLRIEDEKFVQIKPGLSSFADNPEGAADSLQPLIEVAREHIPPSHWEKTPIALYATAGLRLIDPSASRAILYHVESLLKSTSFDFHKEYLQIMDGKQEGLFGWTTVNFLLHNMDPLAVGAAPHDTVGIMDLGGASTQIVFEPTDKTKLEQCEPSDQAKQALTGGDCVPATKCEKGSKDIFVHSYLGLGLNEAVKALRQTVKERAAEAANTGAPAVDELAACYRKSGGSSQGAAACKKLIFEALLENHDMGWTVKPQVTGVPFYAFSYFYDKAKDAAMTVDTTITVADYAAGADAVCNRPLPVDLVGATDTDELCMEMSFLSGLLTDGYKFEPTAKLTIAKHIDGYETSWTLGAMIALLQ